jgi:ParB family transcriptional regulator, chromosome partitioning protein
MDSKNTKHGTRNVLGRGLSSLITASPVPVSIPAHSELTSNVVPMPQKISGSNLAEDISPVVQSVPRNEVYFVDIAHVHPNPAQPRQHFSDIETAELADSIKALGVLQPVLVRPASAQSELGIAGDDVYELVAGERRWRAAKLAGLTQLPVLIRNIDDRQALEIALVENVQRENLNPIEEARAYQRLSDEFSLSQQEISDKVGKDRATVANAVRLLRLSKEVQELIVSGELSAGHAKAILGIKDVAAQTSLAKKTVKEGLSVRALESIVARATILDSGHRPASLTNAGANGIASNKSSFPEVVDRLRSALGTKVTLRHHKSGRGKLLIEYFSEQELDRIVEHICRQ